MHSLNGFSQNSHLLDNFCKQILYRISKKSGRGLVADTVTDGQADGCGRKWP